MTRFNSIFFFLMLSIFLASCSKEDSNVESVVGTWELTTWTVNIPIDLNNDTVTSTNLLDESVCENNELLIFETNGTVFSNNTFNPSVIVSQLNATPDAYVFDVQCDLDGSIGLAETFSQNENNIMLFNTTAVIVGNQLTVTFQDAVDIYNEDRTEILSSKDLILIYARK